jgi:hypoxanthine phosphoribosyltransferase
MAKRLGLTGRHYDVLKMDDTTDSGNVLTAKKLRAAVKSLKSASGTLASLQTAYYDKAMIQNLKANTAFGTWDWKCACGKEATKTEGLPDKSIPLCDGCFFRATVMKAAGRFREFCDAQEELRAKHDDPIDILKRRPLPARSGKTIQMYNYLGKPKKK